MINTDKSNQNFRPQKIAGLCPNCKGIEFFADRERRRTLWIQNGQIHYFTELPAKYYNIVKERYLQDQKAVEFLSEIHKMLKDQVELYAYYMYGDLDGTPDIFNDELSDSENFRDQRNCPSLLWDTKRITIDNYILTPRDLVMIDLMADDYKDAVIADAVGVCHSHFDALKRQLFHYTNTQTKTALVLKAKTQKVI